MITDLKNKLISLKFKDANSINDLDTLLNDIQESLRANYKTNQGPDTVGFIIGQLESTRLKKVGYLPPKDKSIEEETFNYRKDSALVYLEGFTKFMQAGDIADTKS